MNQAHLHLLKQGATIWNSQRPAGESDALWKMYDHYCQGIEAFNPYAYEPMEFEWYAIHILSDPERYGYPGVNLSEADLQGMDLRDYDLSVSNLRGAKLNGADLRGVNLSQSDLAGANLTGVDLRGAHLKQANLRSARLYATLVEQTSLDAAQGVDISPREQKDLISAFTGLPSLSLDEWGATVHFYQQHCAYCGGPFEIMDHFLLRSQGGTTWVGNVVPACFACWAAKGDHRRPNDKLIPQEVMERVASDLQLRAQGSSR